MEVVVQSHRVAYKYGLTVGDNTKAMKMKLEQLDEIRLSAYGRFISQKKWVSRAYNKYIKAKVFEKGQLV